MPKSENSLNELLYDVRRIAEHREKLSENKIKAIYRTLMKDLDGFIADAYKKYADEEGRLYTSHLDAHNKKAYFLNEIVKNVDTIAPEIKKEMLSLIDDTKRVSFQGMYVALKKADAAKKFEDAVKDIDINPNVLKQAINNNIEKLKLPAVLDKHRAEIIYQIQQELSIGLMQGARYEQMARNIEKVLIGDGKTSKGLQAKTMNIARTETHRNVESGFMDCAEHLSEGLEGSGLIYAVTWRTMGDERVRPQQRYKTKKGWKTSINKNGANHQILEGQTVKAGELFDLGYYNGEKVEAKAPSQSGIAAHDCNCRCFLEYNLMTPEEFAKATGKKVESVKPKKAEQIKLQTNDFPDAFTKGAEGKNTQKLIDYVNGIEGSDPNALKLYASIGKLENLDENGIPFKISHGKNHAVSYSYSPANHNLKSVKINYPKLTGDNFAGQVNTTLHEQMHLIDLYGRQDVKKYNKWFSSSKQSLVDTFKATNADIGDDIADLFKKHNAEYNITRDKINKKYAAKFSKAADEYQEAKVTYTQYKKNYNKIRKELTEELDYECRNIMGGGVCSLQDIYDALSGGTYRADGTVIYGHGQRYYAQWNSRIHEIIANYASLSVTRPDLIKLLRKDKPDLCKELDELIIDLINKVGV